MKLIPGGFYHLYNRSNAFQHVFTCHNNYEYFLCKYQKLVAPYVDTIAYCLMRTHYHFLIKVKDDCDTKKLARAIGSLQASYTQAFNFSQKRHGTLWQQHAKAKEYTEQDALRRLIVYIHRNPVKAGYVSNPEHWPYSSYETIINNYQNSIIHTPFPSICFSSKRDFWQAHLYPTEKQSDDIETEEDET